MKPIGRDTPPRAQNRSAGQQARLNKTESKNRRQPFKTVGSGFGAPGGIRTHGLPLRRRSPYPAELRVQGADASTL